MSIKLMTQVWGLEIDRDLKLVLMALADHANDDGYCYPSAEYVGWKTSYSCRQIQRILDELEAVKIIKVAKEHTPTTPRVYQLTLENAPKQKPYERKASGRGDIYNSTPTQTHARGDISDDRGDKDAARGDISSPRGDTVMSSEPSLNHQITVTESPSVIFSKTKIQTEIKSLFHVPFDFDWTWFDALFSEIPDEALHLDTAQRLFDLGTAHSQFDRIAYTRVLRAAYGRKESAVFAKGRKMPARLPSPKTEESPC